jgi:predicted nucleotidyltransferase
VTQPTALDIPSEVQQLLQRYVKETTALLGSQLEGIVLYGSAVRGEFLPGRSNINLLLMVSGYDREVLRRYAKTHKRWSREQFVVPLVLTEPELTRPGLVFPLEYLEIQEQHRVLWGRDPFIGLHIDRTHLAYQVRQELQGNLVRLRQRFIEGGGTEEAIAMLLPLSLTALLPCLRGLQRLAGQPPLFQSDALLAGIQTMTGIDLAGLTDVLQLKRGIITPGPVEVPRLFDRYAANLDALIALVGPDGRVAAR